MPPDSFPTAQILLWPMVFSGALAAIAFYDFLYVVLAAYGRWRRKRRLSRIPPDGGDETPPQWDTRMAVSSDRKELAK